MKNVTVVHILWPNRLDQPGLSFKKNLEICFSLLREKHLSLPIFK